MRGPPGTPSYSETLGVTAPHPFYVLGRETPGFVQAADLQPGDTLSLAHGGLATVTANTSEFAQPGQTFTTYNFAVAEYHTYFVGEAAIWVHNEGAFCGKLFAIFDQFLLKRFAGNLWGCYQHILTSTGPWFRTLPSRWKLRLYNDVRRKHLAAPGAFTAPWHNLSRQILTPIPAGSTMPVGWENTHMAHELAKNVKAALGVERPDFPADLHHLIPHSANSINGSGTNLRALLKSAGIHPNEAVNGLYLPRSEAVADLNPLYGPRHHSLHTHAFLDKMWLRLQGHAKPTPLSSAECDALREALAQMAADIVDGTFQP